MHFNELGSLLKVHRHYTVLFWGAKRREGGAKKVHRFILGKMAPSRHFMRKQNLKVAIFGEQVSTSRQIVGRILNFITSLSDLWPFWLTPLVHDQQPNSSQIWEK
jgi:hypothetical protein